MRDDHGRARTLKSLFRPGFLTLLDIGARGGVHARWQPFLDVVSVVAFEPDSEECARVNASADSRGGRVRCLPYALGAQEGEALLHVCRQRGCSSFLEPNTEFVRQFPFGSEMEVVSIVRVPVTTLARVCEREGLVPDYLKLDIQGSELAVLSSAGRALDAVKLLEVEVEFNEQYRGQPLFGDVDSFLRQRGFVLLGLRRTCWRRRLTGAARTPFGGQIVHGDALFYNASLLDRLHAFQSEEVFRFCLLLAAYRQYDFVLALLEQPHPALSGMSAGERTELADVLVPHHALVASVASALIYKLWRLSGRRVSHTELRQRLDLLRPRSAVDWHDPDFF